MYGCRLRSIRQITEVVGREVTANGELQRELLRVAYQVIDKADASRGNGDI